VIDPADDRRLDDRAMLDKLGFDVVRHDGHLKGRGATTLQTRQRDVQSYRHG
jgi:hypothetical protein